LKQIFGNKKRIFINLKIGCECSCEYCYLPELTSSLDYSNRKLDYCEALGILQTMDCFKRGRQGTILSFGCYSECWSKDIYQDTLKMIERLIEYENSIQISTKQFISTDFLLLMDNMCKYHGHITINVSMPTISHSKEIEKGTTCIENRIKMLEQAKNMKKLQFCMYIRPVLDGITILDIDQYCSLMDMFNIPCVIGGRYHKSTDKNNRDDVGEGYLEECEPRDLKIIEKRLLRHGKVYRHSTDLLKKIT